MKFGRCVNTTELLLFRKFEPTSLSGVDARSIYGENHHSIPLRKNILKNHNKKTTKATAMKFGRCINTTVLLLFRKFELTSLSGVDARNIYGENHHSIPLRKNI